jgi:hypothetical protein
MPLSRTRRAQCPPGAGRGGGLSACRRGLGHGLPDGSPQEEGEVGQVLVACSRSCASNGKVLPFDPMPQILRRPGPSQGMSKGFVVLPDTVHDGVNPSLPAPPTAPAEGPQPQLRGPGRGIPARRLGLGCPMTRSMVHNSGRCRHTPAAEARPLENEPPSWASRHSAHIWTVPCRTDSNSCRSIHPGLMG